MFVLLNLFSSGVIKKISSATGSEKLEKTFDHIRETMDMVSVDIIDLAIKLDHFTNFPEAEAKDVYAKVRDNLFARHIVQRLVASHFICSTPIILFETRYATFSKSAFVRAQF